MKLDYISFSAGFKQYLFSLIQCTVIYHTSTTQHFKGNLHLGFLNFLLYKSVNKHNNILK